MAIRCDSECLDAFAERHLHFQLLFASSSLYCARKSSDRQIKFKPSEREHVTTDHLQVEDENKAKSTILKQLKKKNGRSATNAEMLIIAHRGL